MAAPITSTCHGIPPVKANEGPELVVVAAVATPEPVLSPVRELWPDEVVEPFVVVVVVVFGTVVVVVGVVVVVVEPELWAATSSATLRPAVTMAGVTGAAPRDCTSACPVVPRMNLIMAARAWALAGARPDVGAIR